MADMEIDGDHQPTAGPSRLSPPPKSPRTHLEADVEMEEQQAMSRSLLALAEADNNDEMAPGSQTQEAAELLLGFSSIEPRHDDVPKFSPPLVTQTAAEPSKHLDQAIPEITYPYTTSNIPHVDGDTPSIPNSHPYPSYSQLQSIAPSSPAADGTSPEAGPSKPKQKRKRTAAASLGRRTSTDTARPPHFMGEDNEIIRCICGIDEDDGLTIQCESCYAWQHGLCFGYVDAESAPEIYYCELCSPRPYDPGRAREVQIDARDRRRERERIEAENIAMGLPPSSGQPPPALPMDAVSSGLEKPKSRGKGKRARVGSVMEGDERREKDTSPGTMAPPIVKPRRKPGPKPKPRPSATAAAPISTPREATPVAPILYVAPSSFPIGETEDDYFRIEPWTLEYTPVRENIVRGRETRRIMGKLYKEWVDAEDDEEILSAANKRRALAGPSGLPSPTETGLLRFTPDNLFPSPDFSILAPPVPPAALLGPELAFLGHHTSVRPISHDLSFLPLSYSDATPLAGPFTRPALYGVFASNPIPAWSFIGEFRAEVVDCETYRKDPINQYDILGITKPHVHPVGPPVNLMLDARGYGCELRFIRAGCHPNVVLRPLLFRTSELDTPKFRFGIFASSDIPKNAELVLGWAWDDSHIVHALRSLIHPTVLADGHPGRPSYAPSLPSSSHIIHSLLDKFEIVLTHLLGTFSSCACTSLGNCAIAQMRYLVEQRDEEQSRAGRRGQRADIGRLVGAVRGWRRREQELEGVRRWNLPEGVEQRVWGEVQIDRDGAKEGSEDRSMSEAVTDVEEEGLGEDVDGDNATDDEDVAADEDDVDQDRSRSQTPPSALTEPSRHGSRSESPLTSSPRPSTPRMRSRSPRPAVVAPSSALSSAPRIRPRVTVPARSDDGHLSDATTATIPRSSSDEEDEDHAEVSETEVESRHKPNGIPARKRRVLSPVVEQNIPSPKAEARPSKVPRIRKDGKEDKRFRRDTTIAITGTGGKGRRNRIMSSPPGTEDDTGGDDSMDLPGKRRSEKEIASSLFPAEAEVKDEAEDIVMAPVEQEVQVERVSTPPLPPPEPVRLPTPPPPEPPKKVSISDYLKNRKIQKKTTADVGTTPLPNGDSASADTHLPEPTSSFSVSASADMRTDIPEFNMHDFLPSSRPAPSAPPPAPPVSALGIGQTYESPRVTPLATPGSGYTPRSEYFPLPSAATPVPTPGVTPSFQPRSQPGFTPRLSVSADSEAPPIAAPVVPAYAPRGLSTPTEDQLPKPLPVVDELPNGRDHGHGRYGSSAPSRSVSSSSAGLDDRPPSTLTPSFRPRQRSTSESPVKPPVPLPENTSMPPPLQYREPPPHQHHFRSFASASLSPDARTTGLPPYRSPIERTSPLPRMPPTGPKATQTLAQSVIIPPTGPRGSWQTPNTANSVGTPNSAGSGGALGHVTPATPLTAPIPPSGPRAPVPVPLNGRGGGVGFGGNMRFFEARGAWRGRGMGRGGHHIPHGARGR